MSSAVRPDLQRLPEETVRRYDDDTAQSGKVLLFGVRPTPSDSLDRPIYFNWLKTLRPKARLPGVSHGPTLPAAKRVERQPEGQQPG